VSHRLSQVQPLAALAQGLEKLIALEFLAFALVDVAQIAADTVRGGVRSQLDPPIETRREDSRSIGLPSSMTSRSATGFADALASPQETSRVRR
jgi:hypothetical protein